MLLMVAVYAWQRRCEPQRRAGHAGAQRARHLGQLRQHRAGRHPDRRGAVWRSGPVDPHRGDEPARAGAAECADGAGRTRSRARTPRRRPTRAQPRGHAAHDGAQHADPPGRAAHPGRPGVERGRAAAADADRRTAVDTRAGGGADVPGADRHVARVLRRARRGARRVAARRGEAAALARPGAGGRALGLRPHGPAARGGRDDGARCPRAATR